MQNILQCISQDSDQQAYDVLLSMSPSSLYDMLKSASDAIYHFTYRVRKKSLDQNYIWIY